MKKTLVKKLLAVTVLSSMLVSGGVTASAATTIQQSELDGVRAAAQITTTADGATAKTVCVGPASISTTVRVDYWMGGQHYYSENMISVNGGTAAAVVKKPHNAQITGGRGKHYVFLNSCLWTPLTEVGDVYRGAVYK